MGYGIITFSTVTFAMKAQSLLSRNGIRSDIKKSQERQPNSCQYSLYVFKNIDKAIDILNRMNIRYQSAIKGEEL